MTVVRYTIVMHVGLEETQAHVNHLIAEGWQPLGGIAMAYHPEAWSRTYAQAMTHPGEHEGNPMQIGTSELAPA